MLNNRTIADVMEQVNSRKIVATNTIRVLGLEDDDLSLMATMTALYYGLDVAIDDVPVAAAEVARQHFEKLDNKPDGLPEAWVRSALTGMWMDGLLFGLLAAPHADERPQPAAPDSALMRRAVERAMMQLVPSGGERTPADALRAVVEPDVFREAMTEKFPPPPDIDASTAWTWAATTGFMLGWHFHAEKDASLQTRTEAA